MLAFQTVSEAVARAVPFQNVWPACAVALERASGASRVEFQQDTHPEAGLALPVQFGSIKHGVLIFFDVGMLTQAQLTELHACATLIASRLDRDRVMADSARLAELAFSDALTGISNRRAFDEALERECANAKRAQTPLAILILDVDYFKLYNDNYGHQRGDDCLQAVAQALRAAVSRAGDFVGRYGGEEFIALLPNTPASGAAELAERIRAEIASLALDHIGSSLRRVTVSIGMVSRIPDRDDSGEQLLATADHELYRAKLNGRNRTCGEAFESEAERALPVRRKTHNHLPLQLVELVGRQRELDALVDLVPRARLLTIAGVGGSGKTRVAIEAADRLAERFADGAHFVDLAALRDPQTIGPAIANVLELDPGDASAERMARELSNKKLLLVLDNCEHLIEATGALVETLLRGARGVRVIATSREPLGIADEILYDLPLLAIPPSDAVSPQEAHAYDSVRLFVDRARVVRPTFSLDDSNVRDVVSICRTLDGLPLAVELAAARVGVSATSDLAAHVRSQVLPFGSGFRAEPRQQTMESTIAWSFALLTGAEQAILRRLSIFVGAFSADGAASVCADELHVREEVLDVLVRLARKSMIAIGNDGRYHLLEPIRQFALLRLKEADEHAVLSRHHAEYFSQIAQTARLNERAMSRTSWTFRVGADIDNYRAALTWALIEGNDPNLGAKLAGDIATLWEKFGVAEGQRYIRSAIERAPDHPYVWIAQSWMLDYFGVLPREQLEASSRAYELADNANDDRARFDALLRRSQAYANLREHDAANADLERAAELAAHFGRDFDLHVSRARARAALMREAWDEAHSRYSELVAHYREEGNDHQTAVLLRSLAEIEFARGNVDAAIAFTYEPECLALDVAQRMIMDANLTCYLVAAGRLHEARDVGRRVITQTWERDLRVGRVLTIQHLALAALMEGDARRAAQLFGYVDAALHELEFEREFTERYTHERLASSLRDTLADSLPELMITGAALSDEAAAQLATT